MDADSGALFDKSRRYRYLLWRRWDASLPGICFIMLNPSTADEQHNDPTIARCLAFAKGWRFGALEVVNLFAYRATDASMLARVRHPVGKQTDRFILESVRRSCRVVLAWGNLGLLRGRQGCVIALLDGLTEAHCFGLTQKGAPKHPLYLPADASLRPYA